MPPQPANRGDAVKLKTFDPVTFYPALAAREQRRTRDDSINNFPHRSVHEPAIPKDFDPAVFYPALAAREKAKVAERNDSTFSDSIYPSSSISQMVSRVESVVVQSPMDVELVQEKIRVRRRLWIIGSVTTIMTIIVVAVLAWLGTHNWFMH